MREQDTQTIIDALINLGLSLGEAKTYRALYEFGPSGATALANKADVLQPKIYTYLASLEEKGFVVKNQIQGKPNLYKAISFKHLIEEQKTKFEILIDQSIQNITQYFQDVDKQRIPNDVQEYVRIVQGTKAIQSSLHDIILSIKENSLVVLNKNDPTKIIDLIANTVGNDKVQVLDTESMLENIRKFANLSKDSDMEKFADFFENRRPTIFFTDVSETGMTAKSATFITPAMDNMDPIMIHFTHPMIVNFQIVTITSIFTMMINMLNKMMS